MSLSADAVAVTLTSRRTAKADGRRAGWLAAGGFSLSFAAAALVLGICWRDIAWIRTTGFVERAELTCSYSRHGGGEDFPPVVLPCRDTGRALGLRAKGYDRYDVFWLALVSFRTSSGRIAHAPVRVEPHAVKGEPESTAVAWGETAELPGLDLGTWLTIAHSPFDFASAVISGPAAEQRTGWVTALCGVLAAAAGFLGLIAVLMLG